MDKGNATMIDNFDAKGNLTGIEVFDSMGEFVFEILWDEREAQTQKNRAEFRQWANQVVKNYGYKPAV
jgi:hypothetical protein